jgi:undecaprenyl-diphosphatase
MLLVTLLGDNRLAMLIVTMVVIGLFSVHRWWLGLHLVSVGLCAMLSVSVLKTVIGRVRPVINDGALHSLSFPSGHACAAALITGLLALLLAYRQKAFTRYAIYIVAALLASLIAYSRVHLLAHWPSDVVAGLMLGYALIVAFAWQLHAGSVLNYRYKWPLAATSCFVMIAYVAFNFSSQAPRYGLG